MCWAQSLKHYDTSTKMYSPDEKTYIFLKLSYFRHNKWLHDDNINNISRKSCDICISTNTLEKENMLPNCVQNVYADRHHTYNRTVNFLEQIYVFQIFRIRSNVAVNFDIK
jgi:hypothetical protein